jgi:hypothetical protein
MGKNDGELYGEKKRRLWAITFFVKSGGFLHQVWALSMKKTLEKNF